MRRRLISTMGFALAIAAFLPRQAALADQTSFAQIERGHYLASAGDCEACHTAKDGKPFAGGLPVETPFGVIYSPNITPDRDTGIGAWSDDQFYRAMHQGVAADGARLYPAFPYPWYTKVTRDDVLAIRAYLGTLDAVSAKRPKNGLPWPLSDREVMRGWNDFFFAEGEYAPDAAKPADWNRGAYLVEGLGHCGACHTQTDMFGAAKKKERLQGGTLENWYAPSLAGALGPGLGRWSADDIVQFLKTGRNTRTAAYGPMAEVIADSTSKLDDGDLKAIATYLKDMPAPAAGGTHEPPDAKLAQAGKAVYIDNCSACHRSNGEGTPGTFPALKGDSAVQGADPTTVIRLILDGVRAVATDAHPTPLSMPSFAWKLSDEQIAAVASYIRSDWGNASAPVSASDVHSMRQELQATAK